MNQKPPPLPPRREVSRNIRLSEAFPPDGSPPRVARVYVSDPSAYAGDEPPTERQGRVYLERALLKWYRESSPELLKQAEAFAALHAKA